MLNDELIEPVPTLEFSVYNFHAERIIIELLAHLKTNMFDSSKFEGLVLDIQPLVYCMNLAHKESMDSMQTTIDSIIVQSNNRLMDKYCHQVANLGANDGTF